MTGKSKPPRTSVRIAIDVPLQNVDADVDEVLGYLDDDDIVAALERRSKRNGNAGMTKMQLIYEEFRRRGDAPQVLKDFVYEILGRIL